MGSHRHQTKLGVPTRLQPLPSCSSLRAHHSRQCQQRHLHLRQVPALKKVVGLKEVHGVHAIAGHGLDEVGEVLKLWRGRGVSPAG